MQQGNKSKESKQTGTNEATQSNRSVSDPVFKKDLALYFDNDVISLIMDYIHFAAGTMIYTKGEWGVLDVLTLNQFYFSNDRGYFYTICDWQQVDREQVMERIAQGTSAKFPPFTPYKWAWPQIINQYNFVYDGCDAPCIPLPQRNNLGYGSPTDLVFVLRPGTANRHAVFPVQ